MSPIQRRPIYVQPFPLFGLLVLQADRSKLIAAIRLSGAGQHFVLPDAA
jgi:hypothetical protein